MEEEKVVKEKEEKVQIFTPGDCEEAMLRQLEEGQQKGTTTHNEELDKCWTWRLKEFNLWTGYANEGKSLFLRSLMLIKALKDDWKFLCCSPEDYPPSEFYDDMIHTITGFPTDKDHPACISKEEYKRALEFIADKFFFVYIKPPGNTIQRVLSEFKELIRNDDNIKGCLIDPLMKFERPSGYDRDDLYANYITTLGTHFAREENVSLHLVMHQLTPKLKEDGTYPKPNNYSIKGGGSWNDGIDNVLSVWRPLYAKDKLNTEVVFSSQKIKKQKLVGIPQDLHLEFDRKSNRYLLNGNDMFNFNQFNPPRSRICYFQKY